MEAYLRDENQGEPILVRHPSHQGRPPATYRLQRGPELVPGMSERLAHCDAGPPSAEEQAKRRRELLLALLPPMGLFVLVVAAGTSAFGMSGRLSWGEAISEYAIKPYLGMILALLVILWRIPRYRAWGHRVGRLGQKGRDPDRPAMEVLRLTFRRADHPTLWAPYSLWRELEEGQCYEYYFDLQSKQVLAIAPALHIEEAAKGEPDSAPAG